MERDEPSIDMTAKSIYLLIISIKCTTRVKQVPLGAKQQAIMRKQRSNHAILPSKSSNHQWTLLLAPKPNRLPRLLLAIRTLIISTTSDTNHPYLLIFNFHRCLICKPHTSKSGAPSSHRINTPLSSWHMPSRML